MEDEGDATPTISCAHPASVSVQVHAETVADESGSEDVEDDRRTIRASTSEDGVEEQKHRAKVEAGKGVMNGNGLAVGHAHNAGEKAVDTIRSPSMVDGVS